MSRFISNTVIGLLNLFMFLASISIIGAGLWVAMSSTAGCGNLLQTPFVTTGFIVLVISLAISCIGSCIHVACVIWMHLHLVIMFLVMAGLTHLTSQRGGVEVPGRVYKEHRLEDYSPLLRTRIEDPLYWSTTRSCILRSKTCAKIASSTPLDYMQRHMSPIQSGCCKPPTACTYNMEAMVNQDPDCYRWNNAPTLLCYECDSCKAGVLEDTRRNWHKLYILTVIMLVLVIGIYSIGFWAFIRNARRAETDYPYDENLMAEVRPRWHYYWWRWLHYRREQLS